VLEIRNVPWQGREEMLRQSAQDTEMPDTTQYYQWEIETT